MKKGDYVVVIGQRYQLVEHHIPDGITHELGRVLSEGTSDISPLVWICGGQGIWNIPMEFLRKATKEEVISHRLSYD